MIGFIIGVLIFGAWSFFIVNVINKAVFKTLKFTEKLDPNLEDRFKPFERYDRKMWNIKEMYFCGIFLAPIRLIMVFVSMITLILVMQVLVGIKSNAHREEYPAWKRTIIKIVARCVARTIMFSCGIYWIDKKYAQISDYDKDYPLSQNLKTNKNSRAPIIISNHITWIDIMYHCSSPHLPSFLSKKEVQDLPLFGAAAKGFQCIFVDRESRADKNEVRDALHEREELIKSGKNFSPIVIFPEGTTSNGTHIISFKKGAFEPLLPIKMVCIDYPVRHFNVAFDVMSQDLNVLLSICQLKNNISVTEFNTYYPDHLNLSQEREGDWQIYARKLKDIMLKAMPNKKNSESGYRDLKEYMSSIEQQKKSLKGQNNSTQGDLDSSQTSTGTSSSVKKDN